MRAPFLASCRRIRQFASEHQLTDRPHTMLWLAKAFALPASTYAQLKACQIWGTRYVKEGAEMDCPLQAVHLCLLKRILGAKLTTPNWSVLRECGHGPLQFCWFVQQLGFTMLCCAATALHQKEKKKKKKSLRRLKATRMKGRSPNWRAKGLTRLHAQKRLRGAWSADALAEHSEHMKNLAKCHHWLALPLKPVVRPRRTLFCPSVLFTRGYKGKRPQSRRLTAS
eukprot:1140803-Pelagomonas_calceolata.AAC.1